MKHSDFRDCIPNLAFVLTRGKGWSSKPRMSPGNLGNCAPTALSYACNVDYDEVCDRLVMVGKCLAECADLCAELSEISGFDPNLGTPVYVWVNFLRLYGFGPQDQFPCICKRAEPIVLAGFTGPRETHLATVINGEALGGYDITQKPFEAVEAWKQKDRCISQGTQGVDTVFSDQSALITWLRKTVAQDEMEPEISGCTENRV